jgi:hypothetical protein
MKTAIATTMPLAVLDLATLLTAQASLQLKDGRSNVFW